jgi:hypothetical protein
VVAHLESAQARLFAFAFAPKLGALAARDPI